MSSKLTPVHRSRRLRNGAAATVAVAALIAGGGYVATTTVGADAYPAAPTSDEIAPTPQVMRELDRTIRALYGPRSGSNFAPGDRIHRDLDQTVRDLYGPHH